MDPTTVYDMNGNSAPATGDNNGISNFKKENTDNIDNQDLYDIDEIHDTIDINAAVNNDNIDINNDNTNYTNHVNNHATYDNNFSNNNTNTSPIKTEPISNAIPIPSSSTQPNSPPSPYDPSVPSSPSPVPSPSSSSSHSFTPSPSLAVSGDHLKRKPDDNANNLNNSTNSQNSPPSRAREKESEDDMPEDLYEGVPLSFTDRHSKAEEAKEKHMEQKWYIEYIIK